MGVHSSRGTEWEGLRQQVLKRDGYQCVYCNREADTVDHVVAKANGGKDELSNLVAACHQCNSTKQDRTRVRLNWMDTRWLDQL